MCNRIQGMYNNRTSMNELVNKKLSENINLKQLNDRTSNERIKSNVVNEERRNSLGHI